MFLPAALAALAVAQPPAAPKPFELKDGDRVVWLGGTLVEREQRYGYWETALLAANTDKRVTVRNLGWSGDTVHGESRGRFKFNDPEYCFKQIVEPALELKPTVIFISYGAVESFEGEAGLPKFEKGLVKLLDALKPANARIVLFTHWWFGETRSQPNPGERNRQLAAYNEVIRKVAEARKAYFADVNGSSRGFKVPLTDNGIHFTEDGYQLLAEHFLSSLGLGKPSFAPEKLEVLRRAVLAKNEQFFNKWRPQNETYLFGFRKHEQGKNAKEIAEFDPFIAKAEDEIDRLRKALTK